MATHDYVIANGTGAAVRSDLNDALAAIVSQNSSATAPATTYAYMPWADTTAGAMKMRNGANSGWITLYQLDGEWTSIALENGTAAAPSLYFKDSGTDTGIYSSGTDAVDITTAGVRRVGVSSAGEVTVYGGNVTLNGQGDLRFADSDSSNWVAFQAPATIASNITWTLPNADGTSGQSLTTNGSGTLSWSSGFRGTLATAVASTSGTSIDFTGIPSWAKRVTVMLAGVSTNGTSNLRIQTGAGSITTSGYLGSSAGILSNTGFGSIQFSSGFDFSDEASAAAIRHGAIRLTNVTGSTWSIDGTLGQSNTTRTVFIGGSVTLSGTLDRIRITTVNGTDTFDAGTINILYEG